MSKIFYSNAQLIGNDSDIYKAFWSMHQSFMTEIRNYVSKDWIVKTIVEHGI